MEMRERGFRLKLCGEKKTKDAHSYQRLGVCAEIKRLLNASLLLI